MNKTKKRRGEAFYLPQARNFVICGFIFKNHIQGARKRNCLGHTLCAYVCIHSVYGYVCVYVCVYTLCVHLHLCECIYTLCIYTFVCICACVCVDTLYVCVSVCVHTRVHVCKHAWVCVCCVCMCMRIVCI